MLKKSIGKIYLLPPLKPFSFAVCTLLSTGVITQASAAVGDKVGEEFRVNTITDEEKQEPAIATNGAGVSIIGWASRNQATANDGYDIYAQRYSANGAKEGDEFLVNIVGSGDKNTPDIAIDAAGNFVIVWRSNQQDGDGFGIYGQRYNANGVKAGDEFLVNTNTIEDQENPQVVMDVSGNFVVVWQSFSAANGFDIFAQRYSADGSTLNGEFSVNSETIDDQSNPSIAMNASGLFVVTWNSDDLEDVYAQRYQINGNTLGAEFRVNTTTNNGQNNADVAMDSDGAFIVVWDSFGQEPVPATSGGSTGIGIYAQRFDTSGNKTGDEILINTETTNNQDTPSIGMNSDGDFVVTWRSREQTTAVNGIYDIYAQRFSRTGNAVGSEFLGNTEIEDNQTNPVIAINNNAEFVIAWQSNNQVPGGVIDIYAQRYEGKATNTSPTTTNESNGGGGALSWLMGILLLPFIFGRRRKTNTVKI